MSDAFSDEAVVRALDIIGPRAAVSWCDGKVGRRSGGELVIATFHTLATLGFIAAAVLGFYVVFSPNEFNSHSEVRVCVNS